MKIDATDTKELRAAEPCSLERVDLTNLHLLNAAGRVMVITIAHRKLKQGGQLGIVGPHWSHGRAYADPRAEWPPLAGEFFVLAHKQTREQFAPGLEKLWGDVDFDYTIGGAFEPSDAYVAARNDETRSTLMTRNVNTTTELHVTLTKR
jgi:hypothetical protein